MEFILDHKWTFLIIAEVIFWVSTLSFLIVRYWFNLKKLSTVFFVLFILNDLWIATMGYFDYLRTGEFATYQTIITIALVYALLFGKSDFKKLDHFIQRKVAKWRGLPEPEVETIKPLYGKEHAKQERKNFLGHILLFSAVQVLFYFLFGLSDAVSSTSLDTMFEEWYDQEESNLFYNNDTANKITRVWALILAIDFIISMSYTLFPKKEKQHTRSA
ncbi:hypothetical protein [Fictibacillus phosphorivorans]|uniref:hypothetical protein n=1 Tax=Fictibacillus phosphorivorans TaxID=1221500 RepID=UPI00203BA8BE|nr:hypothetical protein [Fictibacillus phosphorivorans]MCM3719048.1 hypothetical protein [Fictibacillus phosphorivorans]MCM3776670.1 hypothetical protein [Fictibacillus phosphorivorans]